MLRSGGVAYSTGQITASVIDTTTTSVLLSDIGKGEFLEFDWRPAADTSGVRFALLGYAEHSTDNNVSGHFGGILGYAQKTGTGTDALVIGVEGRVGAASGVVTLGAAVTGTFDTNAENAGTITDAVGFYFPTQSDSGHITGGKYCFFSNNTDWTLRTNGPSVLFGKISQDSTITTPGTTGAQTINKPTGKVNFAAGATSLVVTNSLCTTSSIVLLNQQTLDATMLTCNAIPANGSFTIVAVGTPTAEVAVAFMVIN